MCVTYLLYLLYIDIQLTCYIHKYVYVRCSYVLCYVLVSITYIVIALLNFRQSILPLFGQHIDGAEVVTVFFLFWLFVIHFLNEFPDTDSIHVCQVRKKNW